MKRKTIATLISIILVLQTLVPIASLAQEKIIEEPEIKQEVKTETDNQEKQEYSELYKEWLKLSDEEKKSTIEPSKYDIPLSSFDLTAPENLPEKYNLKDHIMIQVKNQGAYGTCYAFSSIKALETNLALTTGEYYDFSEMHFAYLSSTQLGGTRQNSNTEEITSEGGTFYDFEHYVESGKGPVYETEVPYQEYEEKDYDMLKSKIAKKTVTQWADFPTISKYTNTTDAEKEQVRNKVKEHITKYGSVYASIYTNKGAMNSNIYSSPDKDEFSDHAISIVGWDDNYSRENFDEENRPTKDGAYIALNSWGKYNENGGYIYISYEDALVTESMHGIVKVEDAKNEINQYEINDNKETPVYSTTYDMNIIKEQLGIKENTVYIKNEYKRNKQETEYLTQVMIPARDGASCEIYVDNRKNGLANEQLVKKVEKLSNGNNIIKLDNAVELNNSSFTIKVKYIASKEVVDENLDMGEYNLPIYLPIGETPNLSKYSENGIDWSSLNYTTNNSKASSYIVAGVGESTIQVGNMNTKNYIIKDEEKEFQIPVNIEKYDSNQKNLNVKITKDGKDVSSNFTISGKEIVNKLANVKISVPENLEKGCYIVEISYNGTTRYKVITKGDAFEISLSDYWYREDNILKNTFYISDNDSISGKKDFAVSIEKDGKDVTNQFIIKKTLDDYSGMNFELQYSENQAVETGEYILKVVCNGNYEKKVKFKILNMFFVDEYYNNFLETESQNDYNILIEDTSTGKVISDGEEPTDRTKLKEGIYYKIKIYKNFYRQKSNYEKYYQTYVYKKDGIVYITPDKNEVNKTQQTKLDCYLPDGTKDETKSDKASIKVLNNNVIIRINNDMKSNKGYCTETAFIPYEGNMSTKQILDDINSSKTVKFYDKDNKAIENDTILKTGMKLEVGQEKYEVVVKGDLSGDGEINVLDLAKIKYHLIQEIPLKGAYLEAAKVYANEDVGISDMVAIIQHIIGMESL